MAIRQGYRCVRIKNEYSEELEMAAILVHIKIDILSTNTNVSFYLIFFFLLTLFPFFNTEKKDRPSKSK